MKHTLSLEATPRLTLQAETAAELMMPNPVSIRDIATVREAIALLTDKGFSAAPVIDVAGRPIGVISRSDILIHDLEKVDHAGSVPEYYDRAEAAPRTGKPLPSGFHIENVDRTQVRDIMTPVVFSVAPETPAAKVVTEMLGLKVHRLFVVGSDGILVGVISALDVLRYLRP
jgi:CBS domain-containing protein